MVVLKHFYFIKVLAILKAFSSWIYKRKQQVLMKKVHPDKKWLNNL